MGARVLFFTYKRRASCIMIVIIGAFWILENGFFEVLFLQHQENSGSKCVIPRD